MALLVAVALIDQRFTEESATIVFRGSRILTAADANFDPKALVVAGGRITPVVVSTTSTCRRAAMVGKVIILGLVDTHSHLGVYSRPRVPRSSDGNEVTAPVQSIVRALDSLNPFDTGFRMATAGGVTTANVMPGSGNAIGSQTIYIKLRGITAEDMCISSPDVAGGLKLANGETPNGPTAAAVRLQQRV